MDRGLVQADPAFFNIWHDIFDSQVWALLLPAEDLTLAMMGGMDHLDARLAVRLIGVQSVAKVQQISVEYLAQVEFPGSTWALIAGSGGEGWSTWTNSARPEELPLPDSLGELAATQVGKVEPAVGRVRGDAWQLAVCGGAAADSDTDSLVAIGTDAPIEFTHLQTVAELVWRAWGLAAEVKQLRNESRHDVLTGVHNHRGVMEAWETESERAERHERPLAVLFVDLDHFKEVNDQYGHAVGDQALRRVAGALTSALRNIDTVGRYGGDEFLALLPDTSIEDAVRVASRIQEHPLLQEEPNLSLTIGVASTEEGGETLKLADQRLMQRKRMGQRGSVAADGVELTPRKQRRWIRRSLGELS